MKVMALALMMQKVINNIFRYKVYIASVFFISLIIFFAFLITFRMWTLESWNYPVGYTADHLFTLFFSSKYASGDLVPFLLKDIASLNAPLGAHLSDLPGSEDLTYWSIGLLQKIFGLFLGSNISLLLILIANAISIYFFFIYMRISNAFSIAGSVLFGLSHYFLLRNFEHVILTHALHLPWLFVVLDWFFQATTVWTRRKVIFVNLISFFTGLLFVYYTYIFMQLILFLFIYNLYFKRKDQSKMIFFAAISCMAGLLITQLDTLYFRIGNGANPNILTRDLASIEIYSLKIADMLIPFTHSISKLQSFAHKIYYDQNFLIHTEPGYSYLGLIGGIAFLFAALEPLLSFLKIIQSKVTHFTIYLYWLLMFSLAGGVNFFISVVTGVHSFRCTNRYSIFILMISLLVFFKFMDRFFTPTKKYIICIAIILISLLDLPQRKSQLDFQAVKAAVDSDIEFVSKVESYLPTGAKVFQLPVVEFPEYPKINLMTDFEHFRPSFYTNNYSWSYGAVKGRNDNAWQRDVEKLPAKEMIIGLQERGFSALYINKRAYKDFEVTFQKNIEEVLLSKNKGKIESKDLVIYRL